MAPDPLWNYASRLGYAWRKMRRGSDAILGADAGILVDLHAELLMRLSLQLQPKTGLHFKENWKGARADVCDAVCYLATVAGTHLEIHLCWDTPLPQAPSVDWPHAAEDVSSSVSSALKDAVDMLGSATAVLLITKRTSAPGQPPLPESLPVNAMTAWIG